ncbi:MAG: adaptor protein MecA [Clostridia bacterium]|nr:adaptor protein MecA [Clostridia bacterium]
MKFEMLRHDKIKIIIDADDLKKWGVSADAVAKNMPETREMFISMLKQAEAETGFHCDNSRLVVETTISSDKEALTLFVTRVEGRAQENLIRKITSAKGELMKAAGGIEAKKNPARVMVKIDDFEQVVQMCHVIKDYFQGSLYEYKDNYYVVAEGTRISQLSEYGRLCKEGYIPIVEEHGSAIAVQDAFSKIRAEFK